MYLPPHFREDRIDVLHAAIRAHPLATLVTAGAAGLEANPIPFLVEEGGPFGVLQAHLARANGQLAALREGSEALVLFQGPQAYVSPSWYATKAETHKVVPTWNYVAVHCWGKPRVIDDPAWLRALVGRLTVSRENGRAEPWAVEDAPADYVAAQLRGIVGLEIPIARIEGKWKASQNRSQADRAGVATGLGDDPLAQVMRGGG
ncbi:MAG TPA: FMN-binding negative transcriptional regulator [Caulobacteraceae bacterium]|jgi:transcriptional regulator